MTKVLKTLAGRGSVMLMALSTITSAFADDKPMDHSKMDHSKMDHGSVTKPEKVVPPKDKPAPAAAKKSKTPPAAS